MGQNIAKISTTGLPEPASRPLSNLTDRLRGRLELSRGRYSIADCDQPTMGERQVLLRRRAELAAALVPGHPAKIAAETLKLFDGWPSVRMDDKKSVDTGLVYSRQIEWAPVWAVIEARNVCQGRNSPWPPSSGQFRAEVVAKTAPLHAELRQIDNILGAEVYHRLTQEERDASMKRLGPELRSLGCKMRFPGKDETFHETVSPDGGLTDEATR